MAYDKVVDSAVLEAGLTLIGDSIRAKGGTSAKLEFPNGMKAAVEAIDTSKPEQTKTATPSLSQQTISPDSGKVLSSVTVEPITSTLLTSLDPDFKPENIAKDANLFGLVGTHAGGAAVETCSLQVIKDNGMTTMFTGLIDGLPCSIMDLDVASETTASNCICNSVVICIAPYDCTIMSEGASLITDISAYLPNGYLILGSAAYGFRITAPPGGTAIISLEEDW